MSRTARHPRRALAPTALAALAAASVLLAGCAAGQVSQTADQIAAIDGANGAVGDLTVLNARLASPEEGESYPQGSDARLLLWISNESLNSDTLTSITTPAAAEVAIVGDTTIPGQYLADLSGEIGTTVTLEGFTTDVYYGQSIPMTFSFAAAGDLTMNIPIEVPVERDLDRETVEILPPHPTPIWEEGHSEGGEAEASGEAETSAEEASAEG